MKQEISALMDSELFEDESAGLLNRIHRNPQARQDWGAYHLIGDVLRQPEHIQGDLSNKVRERIQDEPTVLAPRSRGMGQARTMALSAAATLAAVGVVVWMSQQFNTQPMPQTAKQTSSVQLANAQINPRSNPYLLAHQEFSPSTDMNGGAAYIRIVPYVPEGQ